MRPETGKPWKNRAFYFLLQMEGRDPYIVAPAIAKQKKEEDMIRPVLIVRYVTMAGEEGLWPLKLNPPDGKSNNWNTSALNILELAESGKWVRIVSPRKHYRHQVSKKTLRGGAAEVHGPPVQRPGRHRVQGPDRHHPRSRNLGHSGKRKRQVSDDRRSSALASYSSIANSTRRRARANAPALPFASARSRSIKTAARWSTASRHLIPRDRRGIAAIHFSRSALRSRPRPEAF